MKRVLKVLLYAVLAIAVLAGIAIAYFNSKGVPSYDASLPPSLKNYTAEITEARVERGEKISSMLCGGCHSSGNKLVGKHIIDLPSVFGKAYSMNITQDKEDGIGGWTDGELVHFIKTGIKKNGRYSPIMLKMPNIADEDMKSIIAYLRSNREAVQATKGIQPEQEPSLLLKILTNTVMKPIPYTEKVINIPDSTNIVALGKYLANDLIQCYACHSKDFAKQDPLNPEKSLGFFGGGNPMPDLEGNIIPTSNLTFDAETGIGKKYTESSFIEAVKYGKKPDGTMIRYPMAPHTALTDLEVKAIYAYLGTIPKINNLVQ